jgi:hypothetical protein
MKNELNLKTDGLEQKLVHRVHQGFTFACADLNYTDFSIENSNKYKTVEFLEIDGLALSKYVFEGMVS